MTNPKDIIGNKGKKQTVEEQDNPELEIDAMPEVPEKPEVGKVKPKRKIPDSMKDLNDIMNSISDTNVEEINETLQKNELFEKAARDLWIVKMSEKPSFEIKMKVLDKNKNPKRDEEGKPVTTTKKFYYSGATIIQKDTHATLLMEREYAKFELSQLTMTLRTDQSAETKLKWMEGTQKIYKTMQNYNVRVFKDYFGATDDDVSRINLDDIINYNDVAVYIEGSRHPQ